MNEKEAECEDESPENMRKRKRHGQSKSIGGGRRGRHTAENSTRSLAKAPELMGILELSSSHLCELSSAPVLTLPKVLCLAFPVSPSLLEVTGDDCWLSVQLKEMSCTSSRLSCMNFLRTMLQIGSNSQDACVSAVHPLPRGSGQGDSSEQDQGWPGPSFQLGVSFLFRQTVACPKARGHMHNRLQIFVS